MDIDILSILAVSLPPVVSFLVTFILLRYWIPAAKKFGLVGKDMNKYNHPEVAEAGGFAVVFGIVFGMLLYVALKTYYLGTEQHLVEIFAIVTVLVISGFIGFTDDILGWKKGLPPILKVLLPAIAALPIVVINSWRSDIVFPFIGKVNVGILYPLVLIPLGITGAANLVNILAGYNGLEASLSVLVFSAIMIKCLNMNSLWLAYISLIAICSLLAFLYYNRYPAKVFPGDSLTLPIGALIASIAIFGKIEIFAVCLLSLHIADFVLYLRGRIIDKVPRIEAFGIPQEDGSLLEPHKKIYDTCHLAIKVIRRIKGRCTEQDVVAFEMALQTVVCILCLLIY